MVFSHAPVRVGLLLGDPSGIGPEIAAKLLASPGDEAAVTVIGDRRVLESGCVIAKLQMPQVAFVEVQASPIPLARVSAEAGSHTLDTLRRGIEMLRGGSIEAMVYAPLNKQALKLAGMKQEDELHLFASLLGWRGDVSEINVGGALWTSRVTSHIPLRDVAAAITGGRVEAAIRLLHSSLIAYGVSEPRIAVAALNPHAGEGGTMGDEEIRVIGPAVERLRELGWALHGPLPADTLFIAARRGDFDGVVSMYHDQGQIALKLMQFERGVTVAGGLPVTITTPAHGTAFDIAGQGIAGVGAMREAFRLACVMALNRRKT